MSLRVFLTLLTLVCLNHLSFGATPNDISPIAEDSSEQPQSERDKVDLDEKNISFTPPTKLKAPEKKYYYPYTRSISPRLGLVVQPSKINDSDNNNAWEYLLGFYYMVYRLRSPRFEIGADLVSNSEGHINAMKRWVINEKNAFRPYYGFGLGLRVIGREGFATATNIDNYMLKTYLGIEDLLKAPMSLRWEVEASIGKEVQYMTLAFGYSWGF